MRFCRVRSKCIGMYVPLLGLPFDDERGTRRIDIDGPYMSSVKE